MDRKLAFVALVGAVVGAGLFAGLDAVTADRWQGVGVPLSAEGAIAVELDGWTYGVPLDVSWTGPDGVQHESGRPACLPPVSRSVPQIGIEAVEVDIDGWAWRQVVHVRCL